MVLETSEHGCSLVSCFVYRETLWPRKSFWTALHHIMAQNNVALFRIFLVFWWNISWETFMTNIPIGVSLHLTSPGKDKREDRLMLCWKPSAVNNLTHLLGAIAETDVIQQVGGSMGHCKSPSGTQTSMLPSKFLDIFVGDTTKKTGDEASAID